jgi:hypothetical protein
MDSNEIINKGIQAGYNVELANQFGIVTAVVLNRLVFLHKNTPRDDGYTWQTAKDWKTHTGLSDYQVKKALDKLAELKIIELKNTYIIGTQIKCRHQRFILKSDSQESSKSGFQESSKSEVQVCLKPVNSIEHIIEPIIDNKYRFSKEAILCAEKLKNKILENYPNNVGANKKDCVNRWAKDIEKMHRIDGRSWENIEQAIEWSMNNPFWQKNIWSGANLRKHYDRLEADARSEFMKHGTITVGM